MCVGFIPGDSSLNTGEDARSKPTRDTWKIDAKILEIFLF